MTRLNNLYTGKSGQMIVMAEFLIRGYNVAIPEVDRGDDIFVVRDSDGNLSRIQVKTATGQPLTRAPDQFICQFNIPIQQLSTAVVPDVSFVFVSRNGDAWSDFIVISRTDLLHEHSAHNIGHVVGLNLILKVRFSKTDILAYPSQKTSLWRYRNDWSLWPIIRH